MKDFLIGASRGRNPTNPSDRRPGIPTENRYTAFCVKCDNVVSSYDNFCSCCGSKLDWSEENQIIKGDT